MYEEMRWIGVVDDIVVVRDTTLVRDVMRLMPHIISDSVAAGPTFWTNCGIGASRRITHTHTHILLYDCPAVSPTPYKSFKFKIYTVFYSFEARE